MKKLMNPGAHALKLLIAALFAQMQVQAQAQSFAPPADYKLVWADEFDTDGLPDPAKWAYDTHRNAAGWYNNERQYYAGPRAENAVVKGGRLLITARKESLRGAADWGGQAYTSSRLLTRGKADWTYGFFEIRAKLPCGQGTWPAIWTLGSKGAWPADGELDILEQLGSDPARVFSTVHVAAGHGGNTVGGAQPVASACTAFHNYQMHWTPQGIHFGVDGFVHLHYPKLDLAGPAGPRAWPFDAPQYLLLNVAIGGDLGGAVDDRIFPVTMEVDYVRVWQAERQPAR